MPRSGTAGRDASARRNIYVPIQVAHNGSRLESGYTISVSGDGAVFLGSGDYLPGMRVEVYFPGSLDDSGYRDGFAFGCPAEVVCVEHFDASVTKRNGQRAVEIEFRGAFTLLTAGSGA